MTGSDKKRRKRMAPGPRQAGALLYIFNFQPLVELTLFLLIVVRMRIISLE